MALRKTSKADLRSRYPVFAEIGLIVSLVLLIVAFRVQYSPENEFVIPEEQQIVVEMEEIEQTQQIEKPPPPPRPPVPVEVPNDEVLEDEVLDIDAEIDFDEPVEVPPPPPAQEEPEPEIFVVVEQMPELIGGIEGLQKRVKYPEIAKKAGVEGTVFLQFVVDENGNVVDPAVVKGIGAGCDEEALKAIRTAQFKPGMQRGKPVKVKFSLPVRFRLK
jgi:protein TonB